MRLSLVSLSISLTFSLSLGTAHAQWLSRTPLARTLDELAAPEADVRRAAAARLALDGPHDSVAGPLRDALEHEAVPEVLVAMIGALARRADASDLAALESAWDRAAIPERRVILGAEDAIGGELVMAALRRHLASEIVFPRACAALVRTDERTAWLARTLDDAADRARVVSCLASAAPSEARDAALLRAGLDLEPSAARDVLVGLAASDTAGEPAFALAEAALARNEALLEGAALALLAAHAPARLDVERWRTWIEDRGDRGRAALRALLAIAPDVADAALETARTDPERAAVALDVLIARGDPGDVSRIAALTDVAATRSRALDRLGALEGGAIALAAMPPAPDVDLALATALPAAVAHAALRARSPRLAVRALAGDAAPSDCTQTGGIEGAMCLALTHGAPEAARALTTERDPAIVAWLAIAAGDRPVDAGAVRALLEDDATSLAALALVPAAARAARATDRRALVSRAVVLARDAHPLVRAEAVRALAALGDVRHRALVVGALEDPAPEVRLAAALGLGSVGAREDTRAVGRAHLETDPRVLGALRGAPIARATAPLHVTVAVHDPAATPPRVEVLLADGRSFLLAPAAGEVLLPDVPDAPAIVRLTSPRD